MKLFHGSPKKLNALEPQSDKRTGIKGVWLTDIREHAMIYAFLEYSSKTNVEWRSHQGKFKGAVVESKEKIHDEGYLYIFDIDESELEPIAEHSWVSKKALIPDSIETVKRKELEAIHVIFSKLTK